MPLCCVVSYITIYHFLILLQTPKRPCIPQICIIDTLVHFKRGYTTFPSFSSVDTYQYLLHRRVYRLRNQWAITSTVSVQQEAHLVCISSQYHPTPSARCVLKSHRSQKITHHLQLFTSLHLRHTDNHIHNGQPHYPMSYLSQSS